MKKINIFMIIALGVVFCSVGCSKKASAPSTSSKKVNFHETKATPASDFEMELTPNGEEIRILGYKGNSTFIVIPSQIDGTPVAEVNFYESRDPDFVLEPIYIPDSITRVGRIPYVSYLRLPKHVDKWTYSSFLENNTYLKYVKLPEDMTIMPEGFFFRCKSLTEVVFPKNLKAIGAKSFYECENLGEITLPESLLFVGDSTFLGCKSLTLKGGKLPASLSYIGKKAFEGAGIEEVIFTNDVDYIGQYAFTHAKIRSLTLPQKIGFIKYGNWTLNELSSIHIPENFFATCDMKETRLDKIITGNIISSDIKLQKHLRAIKLEEADEWDKWQECRNKYDEFLGKISRTDYMRAQSQRN